MIRTHNPVSLAIAFLAIIFAVLVAFLLILSLSGTASAGNTEFGIDISTGDCCGQGGRPGETITYDMKITNTGNTNDSFILDLIDIDHDGRGMGWAHIGGLDGKETGSFRPNETQFFELIIEIPDFSPENDDADCDHHMIRVHARSANGSANDSVTFEFEVEALYRVDLFTEIPGKNKTLKENDPTEMRYTLFVRNLGNTDDDILVQVPNDEFSGEKKDWIVKFGTQSSKTLNLNSLSQQTIVLDLTIDKNTDPGQYTLRVRAESQGDTTVAVYSTIYINLTKAQYGVKLEKFYTCKREVNPSDESEIEFKFTLTNTGNQDDTYTIKVETPLGSGTYKGWIMEFEDKSENRVEPLLVPADLKGNTDLYISKNSRVDITLYVIVAIDEAEGFYEEIYISATSDNDNAQVDYLSFNLTVILPNIMVSDHPDDFFIEPDSDIIEEDDVDIHLRVYNTGGAETDTFFVLFYNGKKASEIGKFGDYIAMVKVMNIPAHGNVEIMATWEDITGGENDIYVFADKPDFMDGGIVLIFPPPYLGDGLVLESKENDNTASISNSQQDAIDLRPDLTIEDVDFSTNICGEECLITVTVLNEGSAIADIGSVSMALKIGGTTIRDRAQKEERPINLNPIGIDGLYIFEYLWSIPDIPANHTVKVSIDCVDDSDSVNCRQIFYLVTVLPYHEDYWKEPSTSREKVLEYSVVSLLTGFALGLGFHIYERSRRSRRKGHRRFPSEWKGPRSPTGSGRSPKTSNESPHLKVSSPPIASLSPQPPIASLSPQPPIASFTPDPPHPGFNKKL